MRKIYWLGDVRFVDLHILAVQQIGVEDHRRYDAQEEQPRQRRRISADYPQGQVEQIDIAAFADDNAVLIELHEFGLQLSVYSFQLSVRSR